MKNREEFEVEEWKGRKSMSIDSERIDSCMEYYFAEGIDEICLSRFHGYKLKDIKFLENYPSVKGLAINDMIDIDISGIEKLSELRYFCISDNKQPIQNEDYREMR